MLFECSYVALTNPCIVLLCSYFVKSDMCIFLAAYICTWAFVGNSLLAHLVYSSTAYVFAMCYLPHLRIIFDKSAFEICKM